jgi:hypothetical protein
MKLPTGIVSNHYKNDYWDLFKIPAYDKNIIEYDGHTPETAAERMTEFLLKRNSYL